MEVTEMKEKYEAVLEENKKLKTKVKVCLMFRRRSLLHNKKSTLMLRIRLMFIIATDKC